MDLSNLANLFTIIGACVAIVSLIYVAYQVRRNGKVNEATFWLELRKMFRAHNQVHLNLRKDGKWYGKDSGPSTENPEEMAKVEAYMGLFEHCNIMLDKNMIDLETFRKIYEYRVKNIMKNKIIVDYELKGKYKGYWEEFMKLVKKLKYDNYLNSL